MKQLLFILTSLFLVLNVSAEDGMPENEANSTEASTKVLDTTSSEVIPEKKPAISTETVAQEQSGFSQGSVTRSIFTTQVSEHEPIDKVEKLQSNHNSIYYFTELRDMSGQTAVHRWEFNGNVMAETKFSIAGPRWRVWSSKNLLPSWTGEWKVSVLNGVGDVISEDVFNYVTEEVSESTLPAANTSTVQGVNSNTEQQSTDENKSQ